MRILRALKKAILEQGKITYSPELFKRVLHIIRETYTSKLVEYHFIYISPYTLNGLDGIILKGSRAVYEASDITIAKNIRDLFHISGYKNSRIVKINNLFRIVCESTENIFLTKDQLKILTYNTDQEDLINKILKEVFVRILKIGKIKY